MSGDPAWRERVEAATSAWAPVRAAALDADALADLDALRQQTADVIPDTDAVLTQAQLIGLLQEHAQSGDTIIAAAGGPPGDLLKVWDATDGRDCHLEFGFSCMGYEIPAAIGVRLSKTDPAQRVISFLGDGTFLMAPTELVTAAQEKLPLTLVVPENHGYQVIHRLQMGTMGREFGNEFRYREDSLELDVDKPAGLTGDYLNVDLVQVAAGLGARALRATSSAEVRSALEDTRTEQRPVVIVVPVIPHADLPSAGCWWDVAPAEVADSDTVTSARDRLRDGPRARSGGSDDTWTATPSTAAASRPGCARARRRTAPSSAPGPPSPRRCVPPPASTGCCSISSTAAEARSRRGAWSPPPRRTASRPSFAPSRPSASVPVGCSTSAPTGVMFPRIEWTRGRGESRSRHLRYPPLGDRGVATYNRMCHYGLDPSALDRSDDDVLGVVQIETARGPGDGRGDRRARRRRRVVRRTA